MSIPPYKLCLIAYEWAELPAISFPPSLSRQALEVADRLKVAEHIQARLVAQNFASSVTIDQDNDILQSLASPCQISTVLNPIRAPPAGSSLLGA